MEFLETPLDRDIEIVRVSAEAPIRMTKRFLPSMIARRRGWNLNTASVAGFESGPLLAVYHASKAFVLSWSEALATELGDADTGVKLTTLCPAPVDTDFFPKADMVGTAAFQKAKVMAPQAVAARRIMSLSAQARMNEKMYEDVPPEDRECARGEIENEEARARRAER